jgi:hypothetical protein
MRPAQCACRGVTYRTLRIVRDGVSEQEPALNVHLISLSKVLFVRLLHANDIEARFTT